MLGHHKDVVCSTCPKCIEDISVGCIINFSQWLSWKRNLCGATWRFESDGTWGECLHVIEEYGFKHAPSA